MIGFAATNRTASTGLSACENTRRGPDVDESQRADDDEPDDHDRTEQPADGRGPAPLNHEQADQDRERERQDENVECRRYELEAFHGRKHRDRRGDDAVAIEQRRSHDPEQDQNLDPRPVGYALGCDKRQQRQDAALAIVIGAQDEDDVFERDHHHQRPEDQRYHPDDVGSVRRGMAGGIQRDGKGVERARADIAEHHAERGECKEPAAPFMDLLAGAGRFGR